MAKGFSIMDIMNEMSREEALAAGETTDRVSVYEIQPNEDNFYKPSNIEQLKNSIYAMGGVQQNLILTRLPEGGKFKYKALAGHRRIYASLELVKEGHTEFELVPAVIKENIDKDTENVLLVMTNSTQRELTDWEKVIQHMKLKEIIPKLKKRQGLDGKTRAIEADYLGVSEGQIGIYNTIGTRLNTWLMEWLKIGNIGISLAYEAAKLKMEQQEKLVEIAKNKGNFTEDDIRSLRNNSLIKGQFKISEETKASNVAESDTIEEENTIAEYRKDGDYSDAPGTKIFTYDDEDIKCAVSFIFNECCNNTFPQDKMDELVEQFRQGEQNHTAQQLIFNEMLPFENDVIRVTYQCGYYVEYIHTDESIRIPVYYFWKAFENIYSWMWKNSSSDVESEEKVTESDTFEPHPASGQETKIKAEVEPKELRGGYDPKLIDKLIAKYEQYLKDSIEEQRPKLKLVYEYNCLLDALELLKKTIT